MKDYFSRRNTMVRVTRPASSARPFPTEEHRLDAACWTANYALNAVLSARLGTDQRTLTLQDRGLFDALAFFRLLQEQAPVLRERLSSFEKYFGDSNWAAYVDLVVLLDVEPGIAIQRDIARQVSMQLHCQDDAARGLITNRAVLRILRGCYYQVRTDFENRFSIREIDTSRLSMVEMVTQVVELIERQWV